MKRMKAFDVELSRLPGPPKIFCKIIPVEGDPITFSGDSVPEIFLKWQEKFPNGISTKGIIFSGFDTIDARKNLAELMALGYRTGYFKRIQNQKPDNENEI
jgi:hypothetical protein